MKMKMKDKFFAIVHCLKVRGSEMRIGHRLLRGLGALLEHYPSTLQSSVLLGALVFLISQIPFIGPLLLPVAMAVAKVAVFIVAALESVRMVVRRFVGNM